MCGVVAEWLGWQVRVLIVTKKEGMKKRTHATVHYNPILPSHAGDMALDVEIVDPASQ
jgi:peptide deformylase